MEFLIWLAPVFAVVALLFAAYKANFVSKADPGNDKMKEIARPSPRAPTPSW